MVTITTKQLADQLNVSYPVAAGLVKLLVANGQANKVAKVFNKNGRGKPTTIYSLPSKVSIRVQKNKPEPKYVIKNGRLTQTKAENTKYVSKKKKKKIFKAAA